ncbi:MAG: DoxX family protein [Terracidiphilus sp.]
MHKIIHAVRTAHGGFVWLCNLLKNPLLLAIRLYWGWQFTIDGWGKFTHLARVGAYFGQLGLPAPVAAAFLVAVIELVGGVTLAAGIATRFTALVLFINMTVAFWVAEKDAFLGVISNPDKFQAADAYNYWFAALLILILGPGLFAVDTLLRRSFAPKAGSRPPAL